jgi:hypothetical protein
MDLMNKSLTQEMENNQMPVTAKLIVWFQASVAI